MIIPEQLTDGCGENQPEGLKQGSLCWSSPFLTYARGLCCFILDNGALTLLWKALDSSSFYPGGPCFASDIKKRH